MGLKRSRSRSREPSAQPAASRRRRLPSPARRSPPEPKVTVTHLPKIGYLAARRTGRLRGQPLRRPSTPPPPSSEKRSTFRASPSPEPAEEQRQCRDGGRKQEQKALYLVVQEHGHGHGAAAVSGYAVHRVDLARSQHGISVAGEVLDDPPVVTFKAAPGMSFFKSGTSEKKVIVGVTDKDACVIEAESVVIDAATWEVSAGPPPSSTEYGLVEVSGKIYAADMLTEDPRCEVFRSVNAGWSPLPRPPFRDRILTLTAYPPRRGVLVSTEKGETYLFDCRRRRRGRSGWVALSGSPPRLRFEGAAVYAKDHGLWFEVSPADGHLHAHDLAVVVGGSPPGALPKLEHATHRVVDPIPVITASSRGGGGRRTRAKLVYLGKGSFCVTHAAAGGERDDGCHVTVTMFRVIDSERTVTMAERRRRRRESGMNARWVADELERACMEEASMSGRRRRRRRKLCRVNMWSRTYIVGGGDGHGSGLAGLLWM